MEEDILEDYFIYQQVMGEEEKASPGCCLPGCLQTVVLLFIIVIVLIWIVN